jgi:hypothetical protein
MRLGPHTVTVVRPGTKPADYGTGSQPDWDTATRTAVGGCSVQPAPAAVNTVDRDTFMTRWVAYAPDGTDVRATDRVEWDGATYEIDGEVMRWALGGLPHIVLNLRRSTDA